MNFGIHNALMFSIPGNTPLHEAVLHGHINVVTVLLESGFHVDCRNNGQETPLHIASIKGHTDIAAVCLFNTTSFMYLLPTTTQLTI